VRWLVVPGGILAAYVVNMAVPSQASTAAALGPILVPLLLAAGCSPAVAGAALVLGASFGGDLLNPGAQDVQAIAGLTSVPAPALSARVIPASLAGAAVAALAFTLLNRKVQGRAATPLVHVPADTDQSGFRLDPLRAFIPLVPIALLLLGYAGLPGLGWLIAPPPGDEWLPLASALPVVRAMLIGALLAFAVGWRDLQRLVRALFDGMGSGYGGVISLTITAQCFGAGIAVAGVSEALLELARSAGALTWLAAGFPWALSTLSGSGSGPILAFAQAFLVQLDPGEGSVRLAALACFGGAFGRTMSPVAAVVVYGAGIVGVQPIALVRRLVPALLAGGVVALALALR